MTKAIARIINALLILLEITIIRIASSPAISTNKKKLYHRLLIFDPAAHTAADSIIITAVFDTSAGCTPIGPKRIQRVAPLAVLPNGISARINNSDSAKNAGAILCNLLLADEINRTSTKTQSALLEVMEEGQVTVDGVTRQLPNPFIVVATQNPVGSAGTQMLPESQLDRFMIRISMGYPTMEEEVRLIKERQDINPLDFIQEIISKRELLEMQDQVKQIYVDDKVLTYLSKIVDATRNHSMITLGVSPRGTLALMDMSKAHAFVQGRTFVLPEDIKRVSKAVLAHRLLLNGKARMSHTTEEDVVEEIVGKIQVPKL